MSIGDRTVKNQHYVPRVYLKYFTNQDEKLYVFDKKKGKVFPTSIKNVAAERYFYDLPLTEILSQPDVDPHEVLVEGMHEQVIEQFLSKVEADLSGTLRRFNATIHLVNLTESSRVISDALQMELAFFVTIQLFRGKPWREFIMEATRKIAKKTLEAVIAAERFSDISAEDFTVHYKPEYAALDQANWLLDEELLLRIMGILQNHIWFIGLNTTQQPLYTSDNPIVRRAHLDGGFFRHTGLASPGIEIAIPITPKAVLVLCERSYFSSLATQDRKIVLLSQENVQYYNSLQVVQSNRQVYCPHQSFNMAIEMLKLDHELAVPHEHIQMD